MTRTIATACFVALVASCNSPDRIAPGDQVDHEEFESAINRYAGAISSGDERALEDLLSSEVLTRMGSFEGGMKRFISKQKLAMLRTLGMQRFEASKHRFEVSEIQRQGAVATMAVHLNGEPLGKRWAFVQENGRWTLNLANPGFSRGLPPEVGGNDWYLIEMRADTIDEGAVCCQFAVDGRYNCGPVKPGTTGYMSCLNMCGFFTGGLFSTEGTHLRWRGSNHCDYNTWGSDVITTGAEASCNDPC
jgi:hypothetical protein